MSSVVPAQFLRLCCGIVPTLRLFRPDCAIVPAVQHEQRPPMQRLRGSQRIRDHAHNVRPRRDRQIASCRDDNGCDPLVSRRRLQSDVTP